MNLYADENFPKDVVDELRILGHDVLTALEAGMANQGIDDRNQLEFAIRSVRAMITRNRRHFKKLHQTVSSHCGIIVCSEDNAFVAQAQKIHRQLASLARLDNQFFRVTKT